MTTNSRFAHRIVLTLGTLCLLWTTQPLNAQWAKWMGPNGDNSWDETGLIESFDEDGPDVLWKTKIDCGYSGPAVADGLVVITDFVTDANVKIANFERVEFDGAERVLCLNETNGEVVWKHEYEVRYTISYPSGPRCTPIIEGDRVYTLGSEGDLFCFKVKTGEVVWSKNLKADYKTTSALWGYAGHPIIDGENLITLAGGPGSHIVALNKNTGDEVWKSLTAPEQGYSPPTIIQAGGTRQLITMRPDAISSINPDDGKEFWSIPYEARSGSIIMTPIQFGDYLFVGGYSNRSLLLQLDSAKPAATEVWRDKARDALSPVNVQPYMNQETKIMYGMNQSGTLRATQYPEGKLLWETADPVSKRQVGNGTAFLVRQGNSDTFWLFNDSGELIIAKLTAEGYDEVSRAKVIEPSNNAFNRPVVWSMPAFANRKAYIRNDDEIICIDLSEK